MNDNNKIGLICWLEIIAVAAIGLYMLWLWVSTWFVVLLGDR